MKLIFTILFLCSVAYGQTNYYVSNSGNDANNGLTPATAWQTIAKVNSSSFVSGDSILFNRGGSWNERLVPPVSNIYFGAYGTGNKPIITGLQTVTGFTQAGNVWSKAVSASTALNMVLINGNVAHKARYPNASYLTYTSFGADSSSITGSLSGTPNYTGTEIVIRDAPWVLDRSVVTSQVGGKLNFSPKMTYAQSLGGNGYFFQNKASFVDSANEYSYDGTTLTIWSTVTPTVQISNIDTLVWISNKSNITIDGISIQGANKAGVQIDTSTSVTIQNSSFNYSGTIAISALKSSLLSVLNDSIQNSLSAAIYGRQLDYYTTPVNQCDSAVVVGNYIKNTATLAGMGLGGNARYNAIYIQGLNKGPYIVGNTIDSTGYIGIDFHGFKSVIRNNIVSNFCFVKDDGGGIYTVIGNYLPAGLSDSSVISSNYIFNGIGAPTGVTLGAEASGIYLDASVRKMTVDSNAIYNCALAGIVVDARLITARYNNLQNNLKNVLFTNFAGTVDSMYFTHNALYQNSTLPIIDANTITTAISSFGLLDSNFYYSPSGSNPFIKYNGSSYTLSAWQTFSSKDLNSVGIPTTITTIDPPQLIVNTSLTPIVYNFGSTYWINGSYYNSINLAPIGSAIVLKAAYNTFTNQPIRLKKFNQ